MKKTSVKSHVEPLIIAGACAVFIYVLIVLLCYCIALESIEKERIGKPDASRNKHLAAISQPAVFSNAFDRAIVR